MCGVGSQVLRPMLAEDERASFIRSLAMLEGRTYPTARAAALVLRLTLVRLLEQRSEGALSESLRRRLWRELVTHPLPPLPRARLLQGQWICSDAIVYEPVLWNERGRVWGQERGR